MLLEAKINTNNNNKPGSNKSNKPNEKSGGADKSKPGKFQKQLQELANEAVEFAKNQNWYGSNTGVSPAQKPEAINTDAWRGAGFNDKDDNGPYNSQGELNPGWVLGRDGKPHWVPLWDPRDAQVLRYSIDDTDQRIKELELELEANKQLLSEEFFQSLSPGELVQCTGVCPRQSVYVEKTVTSGGFGPVRECLEVFPGLSPGQSILYLGWVGSPGEEVKLRTESGSEKVWNLTGPKWLIGDRVYIASIPLGLLEPYEIEVEDEFAQNLGINDLDELLDRLEEPDDLEEPEKLEELEK